MAFRLKWPRSWSPRAGARGRAPHGPQLPNGTPRHRITVSPQPAITPACSWDDSLSTRAPSFEPYRDRPGSKPSPGSSRIGNVIARLLPTRDIAVAAWQASRTRHLRRTARSRRDWPRLVRTRLPGGGLERIVSKHRNQLKRAKTCRRVKVKNRRHRAFPPEMDQF